MPPCAFTSVTDAIIEEYGAPASRAEWMAR